MHSQRDEEKHILEYFKEYKGTFIDIGAFHPTKFSNTRALYENGWKGILIDASPTVYPAIEEEYKDTDIETYNIAIADYSGEIDLYDSKGDALSSTDKNHVDKWVKGYDCSFDKITVPCLTITDLILKSKHDHFDFIDIDIENDQMGFDILRQFDLNGCKVICIECEPIMRKEIQLFTGFKVLYESAENLLLCR